jgi:hypothetical protein
MLGDSDEIVREILILIFKRYDGSLGENLSNSSLKCLLTLLSLSSLFNHSFLHLLWSLELLNDY